ELLVVLVLIGVLLLIVAPNFQRMLQSPLEVETGRLAGLIRALRNEAVLSGARFRLMVDLREQSYFVEMMSETGEFVQSDQEYLRRRRLPESMELESLELMGDTIRPERDIKPIPIFIDTSGAIDPFTLHFKYQGGGYAFRVKGFTGKVELLNDEALR
ncbi:MAG: hypothetical protein V3S64_15595, partial [bacterium]